LIFSSAISGLSHDHCFWTCAERLFTFTRILGHGPLVLLLLPGLRLLPFVLGFIDPHLLTAVIGLLRCFPEKGNLGGREMPISAFCKIAQRKPSGLDPFEPDHGMSHVVEHAPHLALPAFVDRDIDPGVRFFLADLPDLGRRGLAVLQEDACFQRSDRTVFEHALDLHQIGLGEFMFGVGDQMGKIAVIRQEQQALGIVVQPAHGIDTDFDTFQQIMHRGPSLRVGHGGHKTRGFVQHNIRRRLFGVDEFAVNLDMVFVRVGLGPELGHDRPVHPHPAFGNKLFRSAAGGDSRG
jgi:hypothetical protein